MRPDDTTCGYQPSGHTLRQQRLQPQPPVNEPCVQKISARQLWRRTRQGDQLREFAAVRSRGHHAEAMRISELCAHGRVLTFVLMVSTQIGIRSTESLVSEVRPGPFKAGPRCQRHLVFRDAVPLLQAQCRGAGAATSFGDAHRLFHRLIHRNGGELALCDGYLGGRHGAELYTFGSTYRS